MSSAYTFYFEDIFPDYTTWQTFIQNNSSIVNFADQTEAQFDNFCYNLLARQYSHCNIRYSTINAFLGRLLNVYENKFKQFKQEKTIIDAMYALTLEDYTLIQTNLTNMANNPNTEVEDPLKPLEYISAQTYNQTVDNKLKSYFNALNNLPTLNVFKFFKADKEYDMGFDDLFMIVQPNQEYIFKKEGEMS